MPYVFAIIFLLSLAFVLGVWYFDHCKTNKELSKKNQQLLDKEEKIRYLEDAVIDSYDNEWESEIKDVK